MVLLALLFSVNFLSPILIFLGQLSAYFYYFIYYYDIPLTVIKRVTLL